MFRGLFFALFHKFYLFIYLFHGFWLCGTVARRHSCARNILNSSLHAAHQNAGSLQVVSSHCEV